MARHRHCVDRDGNEKSVEELLGDLIWQGAVSIHRLVLIHQALEQIIEKGLPMPSEQINALNQRFDSIQTTLENEKAEILAAIEAAKNDGGATEEELAQLGERAAGVEAAIAALVTPAAPEEPPADPPTE